MYRSALGDWLTMNRSDSRLVCRVQVWFQKLADFVLVWLRSLAQCTDLNHTTGLQAWFRRLVHREHSGISMSSERDWVIMCKFCSKRLAHSVQVWVRRLAIYFFPLYFSRL